METRKRDRFFFVRYGRKGRKEGRAGNGKACVLDAGVHLDVSTHCFFELDELFLLGLFSVLPFSGFGGAGDWCFGVDFVRPERIWRSRRFRCRGGEALYIVGSGIMTPLIPERYGHLGCNNV